MDQTRPCTEATASSATNLPASWPRTLRTLSPAIVLIMFFAGSIGMAQESESEVPHTQILEAIQKSVRYFRTQVAVQGGYVYQVMQTDVIVREKEMPVTTSFGSNLPELLPSA